MAYCIESPLEPTRGFDAVPVIAVMEFNTLALFAVILLFSLIREAFSTNEFKATRQFAGVIAIVSLLLTCCISGI